MALRDDILKSFKEGTLLTKLIYVNLGFFLLVGIAVVFCRLFNLGSIWLDYLFLPSNFKLLLYRPWSIITYMFLHIDFVHLIFNILTLYWFGRLFLLFFNPRDLVGLYIFGGLVGGLVFLLAFNFIPYYQTKGVSFLLGASAAVMAIIVASAVMSPQYEVRIPLIGMVKLEWIAVATILLSFIGITSYNAGGELAHLGGALAGFIFAKQYKKGTNVVEWINKAIDSTINFSKFRSNLKVSYQNKDVKYQTDAEYNAQKKRRDDEVDRILDKIKQSGYDSLSADEKRRLFGK